MAASSLSYTGYYCLVVFKARLINTMVRGPSPWSYISTTPIATPEASITTIYDSVGSKKTSIVTSHKVSFNYWNAHY